jgi:hypothetical protein
LFFDVIKISICTQQFNSQRWNEMPNLNPTSKKQTEIVNYARDTYPGLYSENETINLESSSAKVLLNDYKEQIGFNKIGFARPLGGFFYQFFYAILGAAFSAATIGFFYGFLFPWPESKSMGGFAGILFVLIQTIFNIPTNFALEMFVAEYRVKDPPKMLEFIRFYIWYQMITGVILVTGLSIFTLNFIQEGNLVWAKYFMLIIIAKEYPAMTGIFITLIRALQQFNVESGLNFLTGTVLGNITEIVFALFGRFVIGANPVIGPMMGIAIGLSLGDLCKELVSMLICGFAVRKVIKPWGLTIKDLFIPHVGWDVVKRSVRFGFVVSIPGVISTFLGTMTTLWWFNSVPAYLTFITLSGLADSLANLIKAGGGINVYATLSEAINNRKKELASYYISMIFKFVFFFKYAIGAILLSFIPIVITIMLQVGGAENYILAVAFITPNIIATIIEQPQSTADVVIMAANKPEFSTVVNIIRDLLNFWFTYFFLFVLELPQRFGITAIVWLMPLGGFIPGLLKMIVSWVFIHKKIAPVRIKKFAWQSFIAPIFPSIVIAFVAWLWKTFIFDNMIVWLGGDMLAKILTGVISILFAFIVCAMMIFFPLYCACGGYDTNTMAIFDEAVKISGPSRFLFMPINRASHWFEKRSPLHNRFVIPYEDALREADELMRERHIKDRLTNEYKAKGFLL